MAETDKPTEVDALVNKMQEGNAALADAAQAVKAAAASADEIAAAAQTTTPPPATGGTGASPAAVASAPDAGGATLAAETSGAGAHLDMDALMADAPMPPVEGLAEFPPEVKSILAIEVPVIVQLGTRRMTVGEVMRFAVGAIIEFQKSAEEELDLLANNRHIGSGHAVKVGENFGIKITKIGSVKEVIRKLGAA